MMQKLFSALPNDQPITSIIVVEDPNKCPSGYTAVSKTYDQDTDADLYKDGFWGKRVTRYLGLSKTEGIFNCIIESVAIVSEKESPPEGYTLLSYTKDTDQLAWKKKQLYYKLANQSKAIQSITDIIVLSRLERAPEGFILAGEMNGLWLFYKAGSPQPNLSSPRRGSYPLPYGVMPATTQQTLVGHGGYPNGSPYINRPLPDLPYQGVTGTTSTSQIMANQWTAVSGVYPVRTARPARPAPQPPPLAQAKVPQIAASNCGTLGLQSGLEGVPFVLNPNFGVLEQLKKLSLTGVRIKTAQELENEYHYNFTIEQEAQQRIPAE